MNGTITQTLQPFVSRMRTDIIRSILIDTARNRGLYRDLRHNTATLDPIVDISGRGVSAQSGGQRAARQAGQPIKTMDAIWHPEGVWAKFVDARGSSGS